MISLFVSDPDSEAGGGFLAGGVADGDEGEGVGVWEVGGDGPLHFSGGGDLHAVGALVEFEVEAAAFAADVEFVGEGLANLGGDGAEVGEEVIAACLFD